MTRTVLGALLSHYRRHPFQALTLILGLALATALWSGVQAINAEARASYDRAAVAMGGDLPLIRTDDGVMDEARFVSLRRAGWPVTPVVEGWIDAGDGRVRLIGIDPLTAPRAIAGAGAAIDGDILSFLTPPGRLLAAPETAKRLVNPDLPPVTEAPDLAPGVVYADIGVAQRLTRTEGLISHLLVVNDTGNFPAPGDLPTGLVLETPDTAGDLSRLTDSFHLNLTAFGLLSFAVGLLIVNGAIGLAFEQRRSMFRTLRALGVPGRTLVILALAELGLVALVSGIIGIAIGYGLAAALLPDVAATLRGLYGAPVEGALTLRPEWWAAGLGIALLGTLAASAATLWKIARLSVLAPARPRAWVRADAGLMRFQWFGALALAAIALAAGLFGSGLLAGFTLLSALLLSAALALPIVLSGILAVLSQSARGVVQEWFWADTRQQLPSLSLALMALLLALAANIGVGTMVSSFRLTFTGWLDQRLFSDIYVAARDEAEGARLQEWLASRATAVLPIWNVDRDAAGQPSEIYGIIDHVSYRENWTFLDRTGDLWEALHGGTGVIINEQLARRADLWAGDALPLPQGWSPRIVGVYGDYGNPIGQVVTSLDALTTRFPDVDRTRFGVQTAPDQVEALQAAIVEEFRLEPDQVTNQTALKSLSLGIFERTFSVTEALNVLTLSVAGFAILTSLLTLAGMRMPQLAPAWALGLTRAQLAKAELLRTAALAALTFILAVPVGLGLAWVLLAVVNVEAFGWRLPMHVFPGDWVRLAVLALVAALLAGLWPAFRLARMAPSTLLRVFSSER